MVDAGFDVEVIEMDLSSRQDILKMIDMAKSYGPIKCLSMAQGFHLPKHQLRLF